MKQLLKVLASSFRLIDCIYEGFQNVFQNNIYT